MFQTFRVCWEYRELLVNLTQRELRNRYRRTVLGWLWSLVNPLSMTLVYALVFRVILKAVPPPGDPSGNHIFVFYLLSGILPWNFFSGVLLGSIGSILGAGPLITRVHFPRELIPIAALGSLLVTILIEFSVLASVQLIAGYPVFRFLPVLLGLLVLHACFAIGIGLVLAALNVRYRDVQYLTGIALMIWFYLTPIVYASSVIPERWMLLGRSIPLRAVLLANPGARFSMAYRNIFYDGRLPGLNTALACVLSAVVSLSFGSRFFRRRATRLAEDL